MALEGQEGIIAHHAAAVIGDLDQLLAAGLHLHADATRPRIQRILEQFLYHRRRTLDDFACGDLVDDLLGKNVNLAHGRIRL